MSAEKMCHGNASVNRIYPQVGRDMHREGGGRAEFRKKIRP